MKKSKPTRRVRKADDGMRKLLLDIHHNKLCGFHKVCEQDGMNLPDGIRFLIRWAISQKSLCPITAAEASLAVDLRGVHAELTRALNRVHVPVADIEDDDTKGEEWKKAD